MPELDGLLLLGSFAAGRADPISDVDLVAVIAEGRFDDAWARRRELETAGTLCEWDARIDADGDAASHKWITGDIVKVECGFADATRSAMQLAPPYAVLVGDESVATRFLRSSRSRRKRWKPMPESCEREEWFRRSRCDTATCGEHCARRCETAPSPRRA
jgi:hypothetical protein